VTRSTALTILVLALVLRLGYLGIVIPHTESLYMPDSRLYEKLADDMIVSAGFNRQTLAGFIAETERAPLYVVYLAAFRTFLGTSPIWPVLGQCALDSLTCLLIGLLAAQFHRDLALLAGLLAACNLNFIAHAALILPDSLFLVPFTAHLLMMARFIRRPTTRDALWAGAFSAVALLTRSLLLYFVPLLLATVLIAAWHHKVGLKAMGWVVVACFVPLVVLVGPLMVRNAAAYGHFSLTSQGGTHSLYWVVPLAREFSRGIPFTQTQDEMRRRLELQYRQQGQQGQPQNPFESSRQHMEVALGALREMGFGELVQAWGAGVMVNLFVPSLSSVPLVSNIERPRFYEVSGKTSLEKVWNFLSHPGNTAYLAWMIPAIVVTIVVRGVQVWGLLCRDGRRLIVSGALLYLVVVGFYILAITGPVVGVKYRLPLEPILTVFAAAGALCVFRSMRGSPVPVPERT